MRRTSSGLTFPPCRLSRNSGYRLEELGKHGLGVCAAVAQDQQSGHDYVWMPVTRIHYSFRTTCAPAR